MAAKAEIKNAIPTKDALPDTPPATKTEVVGEHVNNQRPFYIWLPIGVFAVWLALHGYKALSGRSPIDDVPIGALWNILGALVVVILTSNTKARLFDDIDTRDPKLPWWRVLIDSLETAFLLLLFSYLLLH